MTPQLRRHPFRRQPFAMAGRFWMPLTMHALGHRYVVLNNAGEIQFVASGRDAVRARFVLDEAALRSLRFA